MFGGLKGRGDYGRSQAVGYGNDYSNGNHWPIEKIEMDEKPGRSFGRQTKKEIHR